MATKVNIRSKSESEAQQQQDKEAADMAWPLGEVQFCLLCHRNESSAAVIKPCASVLFKNVL